MIQQRAETYGTTEAEQYDKTLADKKGTTLEAERCKTAAGRKVLV